jgi:hypothetical protein
VASTTRSTGRRVATALLVVLVLGAGGMASATPAAARGSAPPPRPRADGATATSARPGGRAGGQKAPSAQVATSDRDLLAGTGSRLVPVVVKFDYDGIAAYQGGIKGAPATSPAATNRALDREQATSSPYAQVVARREADILDRITSKVAGVQVGTRLRVVYGGVALRVPAGRVKDLLAVPGVVAVQHDALRAPTTDSSTTFIGAPTVWSQIGGQAQAGNGLIFGSLDTGIWPEHPSFADDGTTPPAPTDNAGDPLGCDFGDNPLTPADDPFACNDKLVGGAAFLDTYDDVNDPPMYDGTARDSDGHGTHTSSTAAGNITDATVLGVPRGQISGVAPGAWVMGYRVCGPVGCYESDSSAAIQQAILDGVDVINFSIGGGADPASDPVELAFLDAYAAGLFVSASAGNEGPGASTAEHLAPWLTTVAASTQSREFSSTLTLAADDGATLELDGSTITAGVETPTPVVRAEDIPGYADPLCATPPPAASLTGKIAVCERGGDVARVLKGYNVLQAGAAGMILYNPLLEDTETDNHWLPTVHLPDPSIIDFLDAHSGIVASFTDGTARQGQGDVVAGFSSRGPGDLAVKPDITAPGVQILAGASPTPESVELGPPGEYFQAIAGTSMSSPHIAGAGLLLKALHPDWSPGEIKSAMMTSAVTDVVKEDLTTPADPFDVGAGRIALGGAGDPGLVLDETAERLGDLGTDPLAAIDLNLASIDAPRMPGRVTTTRTFTNVGAGAATYTVATESGPGSSITADPGSFTIPAGGTQDVAITIGSSNTTGDQEFGAVTLTAPGRTGVRLPVAFVAVPGDVRLTATGCDPSAIAAFTDTTCSFQADNLGRAATTVDLTATGDDHVQITAADQGATVTDGTASVSGIELAPGEPGVPSLSPAGTGGYLPLQNFAIDPEPIGDEELLDYTGLPTFLYDGRAYDRLSVTSNGYVVVGGGTAQDIDPTPHELPSSGHPDNVLAPLWTDLDGTGADGVRVGILTDDDTGDQWTVVQWDVFVFGTSEARTFQLWLGANGEQDITFNYDAEAMPTAVDGIDSITGAENEDGSGGDSLGLNVLPEEDQVITSTDPVPGGSVTWNLTASGTTPGDGTVAAEATSPVLRGTDLATDEVTVVPLPAPTIWTQPDDATTFVGNEVTFHAEAGGARTVRWERSDDDGDTWATVPGADTTTLDLLAQRTDDGARLRAVFGNGTGQETPTDAATLTVRYADPEGFVRRLYQAVLGRAADPSGLAHWKAVVAGGAPRDDVAQVFATSPEARRRFVDRAYLAILDRHADPSGLAYWTGRLAHGLTGEDLYATLAGSPAAYQHAGSSASGIVGAWYQVWFGSVGNAPGRSFWTARVEADNTPAGRRAVALTGFARSARAARVAAARAADVCDPTTLSAAVLDELRARYSSTHGDLPRLAASAVALGCQLDS